MDGHKKIRSYIERVFAGTGNTQEIRDAKEELLADLYAKYDDFISKGGQPLDAYERTISSIGDIYAFVDSLRETAQPDKTAEAEQQTAGETRVQPAGRFRPWLAPLLAVAGSVIFILLLLSVFEPELAVLCGFRPRPPMPHPRPRHLAGFSGLIFLVFICILGATGFAMTGGMKDKKTPAVITAVIWIAVLAVFFLVAARPHLRLFLWGIIPAAVIAQIIIYKRYK